MDILIDFEHFEATGQNDIINILRSISKDVLYDYVWKNGTLLSKITKLDRNTEPVVIAGNGGYNLRDNRLLTNQIGTAEITSGQVIKPEVKSTDLKRYNTEISMILTYEASQQQFVREITRTELLNACINSVERAILYGTQSQKGIADTLVPYKKNWTAGTQAPAGSGGYWSAQGIYTMLYEFSEAGYSRKNATFMCGSKAFHQLSAYRIAGATNVPLVNYNSDGSAHILGIPTYELRCLNEDDIIFGDFRLLFLRMLDMSQAVYKLATTGGIKINYNAAFECGFADTKAFFRLKIPRSAHDNKVP